MKEKPGTGLISILLLLATLWLMVLLIWIKGNAGWEAKSIGLLANTLHTFIVSFNALFGFWAASDGDRPTGQEIYGHGKRETLTVFFLIVCLTLAYSVIIWMLSSQIPAALARQSLPFSLQVNFPLLQLLGASTVGTLGLAIFSSYQGKILKHSILSFNGTQLFKEAGLNGLTLASLVGVWWGEYLFDLLLAIILLIVCFDTFWGVISWHFPLLLESTAIAPPIIAKIVTQIPGVAQCYQIRSRGIVGQFVYVQMHLVLSPNFHQPSSVIIRQIEEELRRRYGAMQIVCYIK